MRHSRFTQSYNYKAPSLEVTEAELLDRSFASRTSQTIAQLGIPKADLVVPHAVKPQRSSLIRCSHSIVDIHRDTIQRNVTRRMQAAQARGDEKLLQTLEAELRETISA